MASLHGRLLIPFSLLVGQNCEIIVGLVVKAPNFTQML